MIEIGRIVGVHGIKGELKVHLFFPDIDFSEVKFVYIKNSKYEVVNYRFHKTNLLLSLNGLADRTAAEKLRGLNISTAEELKSETIMIQGLKGLPVFDQNNNALGTVSAIEHTGCHEVIVVKNLKDKEILIPYVDKFIKEVNNKIIVDISDLGETDEI